MAPAWMWWTIFGIIGVFAIAAAISGSTKKNREQTMKKQAAAKAKRKGKLPWWW